MGSFTLVTSSQTAECMPCTKSTEVHRLAGALMCFAKASLFYQLGSPIYLGIIQ
jgi:hypothetical protein